MSQQGMLANSFLYHCYDRLIWDFILHEKRNAFIMTFVRDAKIDPLFRVECLKKKNFLRKCSNAYEMR